MQKAWIFVAIVCIITLLLLYGDTRSRHGRYLTPEKAAVLSYSKWPTWTTIEPPGERIRMLWIIHDYVPFVNAGSEVCAHTLNEHFMSKPYKYDIWVACPGFPQRTYKNIRCFDLYDTSTFFEVMKTTHVIHSHSYLYRKQLLWLTHRTGVPFVEWVHTDNYVRAVGPKWYDSRLTGRQWTVFNSKSLLESRPDLNKEHTHVFIPIVDYRAYNIEDEKREPKYVTLSNVNENKGGSLLIQLAKALPDMEFVGVIGGYRSQLTGAGIPNLKYIQHTTEIKDVYAQTWVQIMPSKEETWGRTAVEAMSSGIPVIVAPTPGLRECCGEAAIYCDRADLESWVTTLRKLKDDKEFYNSQSRKSLERARALDPLPELERIEKWLETSVIPSKKSAYVEPTWFEKNMLFR
jgi:glycosyltransferase involved in cell wall biosynthesis